MNLLVLGTIFTVLGLGPLVDSTGVAGLRGLKDDETRCAALVQAALAEYRKLYEAGLKDSPNIIDLILASLGLASNDTVKTVERKVFDNIDETGHETGKKTVVEKTTETDVAPNGTVSKTSETKVDMDEDGKQSGEKSVTESETVTEQTPDNGTIAQTMDVKKIMDEEGNEIKEEVVIKKELIVQPPTNTTEEKQQDNEDANFIKSKNKTELKLGGSGKSAGPQKAERKEEIKEILPGNTTNEVLVKEKKEQLSPQESTKVTSVERKNVTEKGDGKDVEKETVIQKEVERNVCDSDIKEVRNEKHLNETIEDLKHQVDDVKNKIKEEKAKAEETNATRSPSVVKEPSAAPVIQEGKVVEKIVPAVTPAKVAEKIHPTVTEGKVPVVTKEKVVEQAAPSVTEEIVSVSKEQEVPVVAEEKKVVEKIHPTMTEGKVPVVPQQEVVEIVASSPTEEKVPVVTQERVIEQNAPQQMVIEQSGPQERVIEKVAPKERAVEQAAPTATEEIVTVSKEKEEVPVVVTEEKVPVVTNQTVVEKITPSVTEEKVVTQRKVVEKGAPSVHESVVSIPKREEGVVERIAPVVRKAITTE
ncbi:probable serine/threonine-protein kinase kinX [Eriocheir sinensis]|uniref:probable serine/threonine-protein kinase kinX n=1 Tax=Eriocheir sinensis TaxID=95602 RepID=UPI0021C70C2D|nr:probable serine/threonine-protein kinase kinX [Eriocheir sinensis]